MFVSDLMFEQTVHWWEWLSVAFIGQLINGPFWSHNLLKFLAPFTDYEIKWSWGNFLSCRGCLSVYHDLIILLPLKYRTNFTHIISTILVLMLCIFRQTLFYFGFFCCCLWPTVIKNNDDPLLNVDITADEIPFNSLIKSEKEENNDFWFSFSFKCKDEFFDSDQFLEWDKKILLLSVMWWFMKIIEALQWDLTIKQTANGNIPALQI